MLGARYRTSACAVDCYRPHGSRERNNRAISAVAEPRSATSACAACSDGVLCSGAPGRFPRPLGMPTPGHYSYQRRATSPRANRPRVTASARACDDARRMWKLPVWERSPCSWPATPAPSDPARRGAHTNGEQGTPRPLQLRAAEHRPGATGRRTARRTSRATLTVLAATAALAATAERWPWRAPRAAPPRHRPRAPRAALLREQPVTGLTATKTTLRRPGPGRLILR